MDKKQRKSVVKAATKTPEPELTCGLVMPISALDGCPAEHWIDVKAIIVESIEAIAEPTFNVKLVSEADESGVIQKRIVQNVYNSNIVVCDVSGKNPNVMFELGLRLAFDKPAIIIKDDHTDYSFDTGIIEHLTYPRDLRFTKVVAFKTLLADKIVGTHKAAQTSTDYSPFLKNFGKFHVANLAQDVVPADKLVVEMLSEVQSELARIRRGMPGSPSLDLSSLAHGTKNRIDAQPLLMGAILEYRLKHPRANLLAKIEDDAFFREMEKKCQAPQYFAGPADFRHALKETAELYMSIPGKARGTLANKRNASQRSVAKIR